MTEKLPPFPTRQIDAMPILRNPELLAEAAYINSLLATFSNPENMTATAQQREEDAVQALNQRFFGTDWLEQAMTIQIAFAEGGDDQPPLMSTFDAKFIGIAPAIYDELPEEGEELEHSSAPGDLGSRALYMFMIADGETLTMPLDSIDIVNMSIRLPVPRHEIPNGLQRLRRDNALFQHIITSQTFLGESFENQKNQIQSLITEICDDNSLLDTSDIIYTVKARQGSNGRTVTIEADTMFLSFPGLDERTEKYKSIYDVTAFGGELWLNMLNSDESTWAAIPLSEVTGVSSRRDLARLAPDEAAPENVTDILATTFSDPELINQIQAVEEAVNNCWDDDERTECILEGLNQLSGYLPDNFDELTYRVNGTVYHERDDEESESNIEYYSYARACEFDIIKIGERYRVVVPLEVLADGDSQADYGQECVAETVYIIPSPSDLVQFEGYEDSGESMDQIDTYSIPAIANEAGANIQRAITSRRFYKQSLAEQRTEITQELQELNKKLQDMQSLVPSSQISCQATRFYKVDWNQGDSVAEIAGTICTEQSAAKPALLEGDKIVADIPEMAEYREQPYRRRNEFVFSLGVPMYILSNPELECTYFIPLSDLTDIMPFINKYP